MNGEKIYSYDLDVTGVTDYGVSLEAILAGQVAIPPQGARLDVAFAGRATGRLAGRVTGVDYARMRADGRVDLDIRAVIETEDGERIALSADGVAVPRAGEPVADLFENITLSTAAAGCAWVNTRQVWGVGTVDFAAGKIHIDGYMQ
jgi:hypothetical protein